MKDGDYGGILDTIFGATNIFEGQTTDTDVFDFTNFGEIGSEGSVAIFFSQETCVFTPFRYHKRSQVQGSPFRVTIYSSTLLVGQAYRIGFLLGNYTGSVRT